MHSLIQFLPGRAAGERDVDDMGFYGQNVVPVYNMIKTTHTKRFHTLFKLQANEVDLQTVCSIIVRGVGATNGTKVTR